MEDWQTVSERGQTRWPSGNEMHKGGGKNRKKRLHLCAVLLKKKRKEKKDRQKVSWQAAKCCLAHIQLEWCNSGLSSSASYMSWREALYFLGWFCSRWNITIAGFISHLSLKRGDGASRQPRGGGGPIESSLSPLLRFSLPLSVHRLTETKSCSQLVYSAPIGPVSHTHLQDEKWTTFFPTSVQHQDRSREENADPKMTNRWEAARTFAACSLSSHT